ncbi:hypothetical protein EYF80_027157 [Liparis tanakae]|uniref:Uncharacterized protein n=1 Tax=Liparis tanakae TaxID=230148 RepID=A0A4Z2H9Y8_9TELE|nr:hypothetical protein EYF80_027157 [Liparis tanakae]
MSRGDVGCGQWMFWITAYRGSNTNAVRKNPVTRAATDDEIFKHAIRWFNLAADRGSRRRATVDIPPTEQTEMS